MIVIEGTFTIDPAQRAAMLEAVGPRVAATRDEEPGCLAYAFSADPLRPDTVLLFERWADAASLDAHFAHPNFASTGRLVGTFPITGSELRKHHVDATDGLFGADGRPSSAFTTSAG